MRFALQLSVSCMRKYSVWIHLLFHWCKQMMMKIVWIFDSGSKKQKYPIQFNFESIVIVATTKPHHRWKLGRKNRIRTPKLNGFLLFSENFTKICTYPYMAIRFSNFERYERFCWLMVMVVDASYAHKLWIVNGEQWIVKWHR